MGKLLGQQSDPLELHNDFYDSQYYLSSLTSPLSANTKHQAQQRMRTFAGNSAVAISIIGGGAPEETKNADHRKTTRHKVSPGDSIALHKSRSTDVSDGVEPEKKGSKSFVRGGYGGGSEDPVVRSPVMLEFGEEAPAHAASTCGRAAQLPVPDTWDEPEVREAAASHFFKSCCFLSLRCNLAGSTLAVFFYFCERYTCVIHVIRACQNNWPAVGFPMFPVKLRPSQSLYFPR